MAFAFFYKLQFLWPFSLFKFDDLRASHDLVRKLSIPDHTKNFVFAVSHPDSQSVIYILSTQNLSERSAADAECLIGELKPDAVIVQIDHTALTDIQSEHNLVDNAVPTSSFGVLKRCFLDRINKDQYEDVAGKLVLREIFGVGFHGHFLAAKRAAREVGSTFLVLESSFTNKFLVHDPSREVEAGSKIQGLVSSLVPKKGTSVLVSSFRRFCITSDVQSQMVKLLSSHINLLESGSASEVPSNEIQPRGSYEAPPFAQSIYPLLVDLHDIFVDLPSIGKALALSQKMLLDVNRGEVVDTGIISEVCTFRIAVEALRIALNNAGQLPIDKLRNAKTSEIAFAELPVEDKSHALLAQALQSQAKKFKTVVAIVDASSLAGLRANWNTPVPLEVKDLVAHLVTDGVGDGDKEASNHTDKKRLLSNKPVVAVGAGATAVLGASSISKVIPASTFMKVVTLNVPASVKLVMTQTQKVVAIALGKTLGPSKLVAPGLASSGANSSLFKAVASAEKIRTVVHGVIASAEKTSFSAMRTAFYEIMRKRRVQPIGVLPWATFGCSIATCTSLLVYGDGIECVAESLPAAPSIASLGRGIQSLHQASQALKQKDGNRIQKSIESLMYRLKKVKIQ
ncbi:uncharacterized protein LOC111312114 [Durio zibethinus]|uniref:Uncharacterized protein LOC111312114 n=1 Tax=Durio zibethinus TaxID=66656 RepID=A0A6P6ASJ0_DURZI|nr:uncharacterized protein LOC111312114 [Durio zibethinus]